jgi:pSer/pThr/pTyr-binding forkhead associated (FHA) protein
MPPASLHVLSGPRAGLRVALTKDRFVIGRAKSSDLVLPDVDVSRQHSLIELAGGAFWLVDLGSTHGPMIDGRRVVRHELSDGDEFAIGETTIRYEVGEPKVLH